MHGNKSRWVGRAGAAVLAIILLPLVGSSAPNGSRCRKVHGRFTLQVVSGPGCSSPIGICATGSYQGAISGTSFFTVTSLVPTVDTAVTSVVLLTGDNVIQTKDGSLTTKDAIVQKTTGAGEFAEVDEIIGGTGELAGATGTLTATGTLSGATGEGVYSGELCTPD
jgi:hypothetical protein